MTPSAVGHNVIEVKGLNFAYYQKKLILEGANLTLAAGESLALLGANGSGKSTFIDLLVGLLRPDSGSISVFGGNPVRTRRWMTQRVAVVRQNVPFSERLKVHDIVRLYSSFYGVERRRARQTFVDLGLGDSFDQFIDELSGGQKQRLSLAIGLLNEPELLVLDEPSSGLDLGAYDLLIDSITRIKCDRSMAVLIVSHVTDFVERTCEKVAFMRAGKLSPAIEIETYLRESKGHHVVQLHYASAQGIDSVVEVLKDNGYKAMAKANKIFCHDVAKPEALLQVIHEGLGQSLHPVLTRHSVREQNLKSLYFEMTGEESGHTN
ncbi:MAG: ABC transporter ATP-binding protein [Rhodanobacter sp.]|nr:MAG: ABC transporter ATP-binding protein [Rhodanobacter sp.]